jgi:hypothetical protein
MTKKTLLPEITPEPTEEAIGETTASPDLITTEVVKPTDEPTEALENPPELQDDSEFEGEDKVRTDLHGNIIYTPPHLR